MIDAFVLFKVNGVRWVGRDRVHENNSGRLRSNRIGHYFSDKADKAEPRGTRNELCTAIAIQTLLYRVLSV